MIFHSYSNYKPLTLREKQSNVEFSCAIINSASEVIFTDELVLCFVPIVVIKKISLSFKMKRNKRKSCKELKEALITNIVAQWSER